ncbi:MAG: hypothetical protein P4L76_00670 [Beijerinckiaceae bacterium]|nr:hypothetical protein [Beijerinckiaceae bacterium]
MNDKTDLERIKDRAQDVREDVNALALETVEATRKALDELTALVRANAYVTRDLGYAKIHDLSASIQRNPLTSVAVGVGIGVILGSWRKGGGRR